jgi:cation:H+ antiporter
MSMLAMFLLGLLLLLFGTDSLLRGAAGLGQRLGMSPFGSGLLLVGVVASIPDLAVNVLAFATGLPDIALGNAIGGNVVSLGLVLGFAALLSPLVLGMRLLAGHALFVLLAAGVVLMLGFDGRLARWEGALLFSAWFACLAFLFLRGRQESAPVQAQLVEFAETSTIPVQNLIRIGFSGALLYFGSRWTVQGASALGQSLGMDEISTGLTLLAVGTAVPKLLVAGMAAARGQGNVVVAQVLGACLFNLLFVLGAMALAQPLALANTLLRVELSVVMALALLLYFRLAGGLAIGRGHAAILLLAFAAWLGYALSSALG